MYTAGTELIEGKTLVVPFVQCRWERKHSFSKLNNELVFLQAKTNLIHSMSTEQSTYSGDILEDAHLEMPTALWYC